MEQKDYFFERMGVCFKLFLQSSLLLRNTVLQGRQPSPFLLNLYDLDDDTFILLRVWSTLQVDIEVNYTEK